MSISEYFNNLGVRFIEGYSQQVPQQVEDLISLTNKPNIKVMEIGFNGGHSSEIFLQNNPDLTVLSFDLGKYNYVALGKEFIDTTYPNRHTLIVGDSTKTIPVYLQNNKDAKFDVIFIDGGHEYEISKKDLENCFHLAHKDTIVILDDTIFTPGWEQEWTHGPTRNWIEYIQQNKIVELNRKDYSNGRGMSWGKYVM
jgi:predicted O-methyltransferase YrrM